MCLGDVARVLSIGDDTARVATAGGEIDVSLAVLRTSRVAVEPGEWVIVSMGFALDTIAESDALAIAREVAALRGSPAAVNDAVGAADREAGDA